MRRYQERFLAYRRIYFFDDFVFLQCAKATHRDDIVHQYGLELADVTDMREIKDVLSPSDYQFQAEALKHAIETYSKRDLTCPSDILNAFMGISNYFKRVLKTKIHYGIPQAFMARSLCWQLCPTKTEITQPRREGFPSWSWIGWSYPVKIPHLDLDDQDPHLWTQFTFGEIQWDLSESSTPPPLPPKGVNATESHIGPNNALQDCQILSFTTLTVCLKVAHPAYLSSSSIPPIMEFLIQDHNEDICGRV